MAKIIGGVVVTGFISPSDTGDSYAVIDPIYGIDGLRNYSGDSSVLDSITTLRRRAGMLVGVNDGTEMYQLKPAPWVNDITDWNLVNFGNDANVVHKSGTEIITGFKTVIPIVNTTGFLIDMPAVDNTPTGGVPDALRSYVRGHNGITTNLVSGHYITMEGNKNAGIQIVNLEAGPDATSSYGVDVYFKTGSISNNIIRGKKGDNNTVFLVSDNGDLTANTITKIGGLSTQYLMADGSVSTGGGGGVGGTGTPNYMSKWSTASELTDSLIYDNGTNIGIGTTTGTSKVTINLTPNITGMVIDMPMVDTNPTGGVPDAYRAKIRGHNGTSNSEVSGFYSVIAGNKSAGFVVENNNADPDITSSVGFTANYKVSSSGNKFFRGSKGYGNILFEVTDTGSMGIGTASVPSEKIMILPEPNNGGVFIDMPLVSTSPVANSAVPDAFRSHVRGHNGTSTTKVCAVYGTFEGSNSAGFIAQCHSSFTDATDSLAYGAFFKSNSVGNIAMRTAIGGTTTFQMADNGSIGIGLSGTSGYKVSVLPAPLSNGMLIDMPLIDNTPTGGVPDAFTTHTRGHNGNSTNRVSGHYAIMEGNRNAGFATTYFGGTVETTNSVGYYSVYSPNSVGNFHFIGRRGSIENSWINDFGAAYFADKISIGTTLQPFKVTIGAGGIEEQGYGYVLTPSNWGPVHSSLRFSGQDSLNGDTNFSINLWKGTPGDGYGGSVSKFFINGYTGNVGIQVGENPAHKLHVNGDAGFVYSALGAAPSSYYKIGMRCAFFNDFEQGVILLHPVYNGTLSNHYECKGTFSRRRGHTGAGLSAQSYYVDTATAYNSNQYGLSSKTGDLKLYNCMYNGVMYVALLSNGQSATEWGFDGYITGDANALIGVTYYNTNSGLVINPEINSSLLLVPSYTPTFTQGSFILDKPSGANISYKFQGVDDWVFGENSGDASRNFNIYNYNTSSVNLSINQLSGDINVERNLTIGGVSYHLNGISVGTAGNKQGILAVPNAIAIGDTDTGFLQGGDGVLQTTTNGIITSTHSPNLFTVNGHATSTNLTYRAGIDIGGQNVDGYVAGGFFTGANLVNGPLNDGDWYQIQVNPHTDGNSWARQNAYKFGTNGGTGRAFTRAQQGSAWTAWMEYITDNNIFNYAVPSRAQHNWSDGTVVNNVIGMLGWKNYGNGHVIFDASAGTSPSGGGIDNANASNAWNATYPTLMGWNGNATYGVRVDSARASDYATNAGNATNATTASNANALGGVGPSGYVQQDGSGNVTIAGRLQVRAPLADNTPYGTADDTVSSYSSIVIPPLYVNQSDTAYYPMITGYNVLNGIGYTNQPSFGYMRPTGGYNSSGEAIIQLSGDGTGITRWRFRANGILSTPSLNVDNGAQFNSGILVYGVGVFNSDVSVDGSVVATGNLTAGSDKRIKTNIQPLENSLEKVLRVEGVKFDRTDCELTNQIGFIAQDLEKEFPELVITDTTEEKMKSVNYQAMVAVLVEAIKEQQKQINELKEEIINLKK